MKNLVLVRIEEWGEKTPEKIAIFTPERSMTYRELIDSARKLSLFLRENQFDQTGLIGVLLSQCYELPICLLAIWMVGSAYVPLDPIYPKNRILSIIEQVEFSCILTNSQHQHLFSEINHKTALVNVENNYSKEGYYALLSHPQNEEDLAYLVFTSGTTGKPKGVSVSYENLFNVLTAFERKLQVDSLDKLLSITPISFDIFALELFLPLICGATCYLTDRAMALDPNDLLAYLEEKEITLFQATPSSYHLLVEEPWPKLQLRHLLCGGEAWDKKLATAILNQMPPQCTLWNVYGPTETTIWSSLCKIRPEEEIYIAPSIDGTVFYVLDERLQPASEGELYIGGKGVAKGYYKDEALTQKRFMKTNLHPEYNRIYKTGDFVRQIGEGKYQFIGRKDHQIKIRGFRVEIGDIEQALLKCPSILRVAVIYDYFRYPDEKSLVACLETKQGDDVDWRKFLLNQLPSYMIPQHFIQFEALPLTPNLKIDRQKISQDLKLIFQNA